MNEWLAVCLGVVVRVDECSPHRRVVSSVYVRFKLKASSNKRLSRHSEPSIVA